MKLSIEKKYLWFPIKNGAPKTNLELFQRGSKVAEMDIETGETEFDFYAYLNVEAYIGSELALEGCFPQAWADKIRNEDRLPASKDNSIKFREADRPLIHFTADIGWINDPNGLIYADGVYHMFFQHNPFGTAWGNMTWGHATSPDLLHWTQQETALYPDETGTMFSGCAYQDSANLADEGENALLFYYTAAGNYNNWSKEKPFTQHLAVSTDSGKTLCKRGELIGHIAGENRDPKVFFHAPSKAYVMVLFLDGNDFAIFRSADLKNWELSQRLTLDRCFECPDLLCLSVDGGDETRWVFWSADGFYYIGDFDGFAFTPVSGLQKAYATKLPYAAQTYAGTDGRTISQSWLRTENRANVHTGVMAIPAELSLKTTADGLHLALNPVEEIRSRRTDHYQMKNVCRAPAISLGGSAAEIDVLFPEKASGTAHIELSGQNLLIDFDNGILTLCHEKVCFDSAQPLSLNIFLDYEVIEIYGNGGLLYMACENRANKLDGHIQIVSDQNMVCADAYLLK